MILIDEEQAAQAILRTLRYAVSKAKPLETLEPRGNTGYSDEAEIAGIIGTLKKYQIKGQLFVCPDCGYDVMWEEVLEHLLSL